MPARDHTTPTCSDPRMVACATAFASAVKNLTIYPADHPRVVERAREFAAQFAELGKQQCELTFHGGRVAVDGAALPNEHLALDWLAQRGRDAGLCGVRLETGCRADDVVTFAAALVACRPGDRLGLAAAWQHPESHVQPLALVVDDVRAADGRQPTRRSPDRADARATRAASSVVRNLEQVAATPAVQSLLRGIEAAGGADHLDAQSVDLIELIGELLPVDGPRDVAGLTATVEQILTRVQGEMHDILRQDVQVRGASLLRSAVDLARTFFGRAAPDEQHPHELPEGRPEDAGIQADLAALLAEYRALPDARGLRLPPIEQLVEGAPTTGCELLGICLHALVHGNDARQHREHAQRIAALLQEHPGEAAELLDVYMTPRDGDADTAPIATRLAVLGALSDAGLGATVRARGYLDEDLLQAGFPEVLRLAARTFAEADEHERLRRALATLTPVLENGGYDAAAKAGVLDDPAVVELLAHAGGDVALALLSRCESNDRDVLRALRAFAARLELPPAEAAALTAPRREGVPAGYLRRLLRAAARRRFDDALRRATGELLRADVVDGRDDMPLPMLERAIDALQHAPDERTVALLEQLQRFGRLVNFGPRARTTRRVARETLAAVRTRRSS